MSEEIVESIDEQASPSEKSVEVSREPYDSRPMEDKARQNIAYLLLALLMLICLASFILVITQPHKMDDIITLIQLILSPIVTLVSAATGFYYGSKSKSQ